MKSIIRLMFIFILTMSLTTLTADANDHLIDVPEIAKLQTDAKIYSAVFSQDDKVIITGDSEGFISLWSAETGELATRWKASEKSYPVKKVILDPNGETIATAAENELSVWDLDTGYLESQLKNADHNILDIAFNNKGTIIYTAYNNETVAFWDTKSEKQIVELSLPNNAFALAYNATDEHLAVGLPDGKVSIWNANIGSYITGVSLLRPDENYYYSKSLHYSADDLFLYGGGIAYSYRDSKEIFAADVQLGYKKIEFQKDEYEWNTRDFIEWETFSFSPNEKYVAVRNPSGRMNNLKIYDLDKKEIVNKEIINYNQGTSIQFSHNNKRLISGNVIYDTSFLPDRGLQNIKIDQESRYMAPGESQTLGLIGEYSDGTIETIKPSVIKWTSSNPSVAKFSYGKLEALSLGNAVITAEHNGFKTSIDLNVKDYKILPNEKNIAANKIWNVTFNASVNPYTIKDRSIYVTDKNDEILQTLYYVEKGQETNVQVIPLKDYSKGETYTLWVKDIDSATGKPIKQYTKMDFTITKK